MIGYFGESQLLSHILAVKIIIIIRSGQKLKAFPETVKIAHSQNIKIIGISQDKARQEELEEDK